MSRLGPERVLLIGDSQKSLQTALAQAMPAAHVISVPDYFEAIAELAGDQFTALLAGLPLASLFLSALADQPHAATAEAIKRLNLQLGPSMQLIYQPMNVTAPMAADGKMILSHPVKVDEEDFGQLHLLMPKDED